MSRRLAGKTAIVTGASKGIGAAIALRFAEEGASVVVNYASSKDGADRVVQEIRRRDGKAVAVQADVSRPEDIRRLFDEARKAFGPLDILVNNAGAYEFAAIEAVTPEHFRKLFDLNVLGLLLSSQEAVRHFRAGGGSIVNISSVASMHALPEASVYAGTKASVDAVTRTLAAELGPRGIRVNAINPGMIETEGVRAAGLGEFRARIESETPLGRVGRPEDVAPVAAFLASTEAGWITGETLIVAGGYR